MNPVRPEELSALLDGELEPARARELKEQIATDAALRQEFEALSAADAAWRAAAGAAAFTPSVEMPTPRETATGAGVPGWLSALAVAAGILIALRIVLKLTGSEAWTFALPATLLALLWVGVVCLVRSDDGQDVCVPQA